MNLKDKVVEALKSVYDPELNINVVDLGLIYNIDVIMT
jgi:metal-sulfur cluster biosynthetic enzyme